jgi:hypothetical protein
LLALLRRKRQGCRSAWRWSHRPKAWREPAIRLEHTQRRARFQVSSGSRLSTLDLNSRILHVQMDDLGEVRFFSISGDKNWKPVIVN